MKNKSAKQGRVSGGALQPSAGQQGVALLEALISILIFSISILALVGLQAAMNRNTTEAKYRAEASYLANQLVGQMWADQPNLAKYAMTAAGCADANYARCTAWRGNLAALLPGGNAVVTVAGTSVNITVNWQLQDQPVRSYQLTATITS